MHIGILHDGGWRLHCVVVVKEERVDKKCSRNVADKAALDTGSESEWSTFMIVGRKQWI